MLTFGQIFGIVKSEGSICNEIKLQTKYGSLKAQSRKEMGTFCEAFGIKKFNAPSVPRKRAQKKRVPFNKKKSPKPYKPYKEAPKPISREKKA